MPSSSGSYSFQSIKAELIIRKAYELIGIPLSMVTSDQYDSAKNAINFILTDWFNQNVNLWTQKNDYINLTAGQSQYSLPSNIQTVTQCFLRNSTRQNVGGTAFSSDGGIAANAFDGNPLTACTQTAPNGIIKYSYGANDSGKNQTINLLGIQSNVDRTYTVILEGSFDNINWVNLYSLGSLPFIKGVSQWFSLNNIASYISYRIRETGGATLDIQEIYFNNRIVDTVMTEVSRYEYLSYANKFSIGRPTVYYIDYQQTLNMNIWQRPKPTYNLIYYSGQSLIQTLESYTESVDIPSIFYMPLVYGLAETLANQYAPEKADGLKNRYNEYMDRAVINNTAEVPLSLGVYNG